jgi:hypothetical protein
MRSEELAGVVDDADVAVGDEHDDGGAAEFVAEATRPTANASRGT